jgi:multicomponent Na+:H+ antiporter subunit G
MRTVLASAALLVGAAFMFVAALGVVRLPDLYTRMQAATKAAAVGVGAIMGAIALSLDSVPVTVRAGLVAVFLLLTAPVAAHAIARSAHSRGVPLAPGTRVDRGEAGRVERRPRRPAGGEPGGAAPSHAARAARAADEARGDGSA